MKYLLRQKFSAFGLQGCHQSGTVNAFQRCLRKKCTCGQETSDKYVISFENKFRIDCGVFVIKITWSHVCVFPLQNSRKSFDFDSFSDFLRTNIFLETSLGTIFNIMYKMLRSFYLVLLKESQIIFH